METYQTPKGNISGLQRVQYFPSYMECYVTHMLTSLKNDVKGTEKDAQKYDKNENKRHKIIIQLSDRVYMTFPAQVIYLNDFIDTKTFCETLHFYGKSSVKFLSHPWVETMISRTAKNRNCDVSLVRNVYFTHFTRMVQAG